MKLLTVSALLCAVMALTTAANGTALNETETLSSADPRGVNKFASCTTGWTEFNGKCYIYEPKSMTYAEAQKNCQSKGANLASVHSDAEYKHLQNVVYQATYTNGHAWIGGSDSLQEGLWYWSDGTTFEYKKWCPGEPDNGGGNQDCAYMNYGSNGCFDWDDGGCATEMPSICVKRTPEL
ncbi:ladderlectin-like isoform X2 [Parambassis ranga]|uniref:Ladderlectin-like isoform X2 n=1 Tax=Parambassis ranga TaxID=210632 RepID=A0A6P7IB39_9TELE|nr:ladderlectin-like isoform X2 [Parambassis ranga]